MMVKTELIGKLGIMVVLMILWYRQCLCHSYYYFIDFFFRSDNKCLRRKRLIANKKALKIYRLTKDLK